MSRHPLAVAMEARDLQGLIDTLSSDVVLHSAVTRTTFEGRETVGELYGCVMESFEELEVVDEFSSGDTYAFFWRGRMEGRFVEGADRLRVDDTGKVREITIVGRPLSGLATFLTGIGSRFARSRRGALVARTLELTVRPLPPVLAALDPMSGWLMRARPGKHAVVSPHGSGSAASPAYVPERTGNPFVRSPAGGRVLSASQLPWFTVLPPSGFGVLTTRGRRTGKTRRRCVRAIRKGNKAYIVAIGGEQSAWVKNIRANPNVRLRIRGGAFAGVARELRDAAEEQEAMAAYCETVNQFDYAECAMHRQGRPTRAKIEELHRSWFQHGTPLVVDLP
ncbi:MAG TPA: nitroreductase family deazaflavin-dependent oxidoreductase [Thermoleophilaceae bacterium]|nr:nitroreductase family deazaflavin-dependent oxidoreductase [Thermoleophilaceae bacterium]